MSWWVYLIIYYVVCYTLSVRIALHRQWVNDYDVHRNRRTEGAKVGIACFMALALAPVLPAILLGTFDLDRTERPTRSHRRSLKQERERAELAELKMRQAKAQADRERELGIIAPYGINVDFPDY